MKRIIKSIKFIFEGLMSLFWLHERVYKLHYIRDASHITHTLEITTRIKSEEWAMDKAMFRLGHLYEEEYLKIIDIELIEERFLQPWE